MILRTGEKCANKFAVIDIVYSKNCYNYKKQKFTFGTLGLFFIYACLKWNVNIWVRHDAYFLVGNGQNVCPKLSLATMEL